MDRLDRKMEFARYFLPGFGNHSVTPNVLLVCLDIYWVKMLSSFDQLP